MNKEYDNNQKKQRKAFKKYRKYIGKILLWAAIGVTSAFILPWRGLFNILNPILGDYMAGSVTFLSQWGLAGLGAIGSVVNAVKANKERKKIDDSQDEEENIIDSMINENDDLKKKVESLEKSKTKTLDESKQYTKTYEEKDKDLSNNVNLEEEKAKKFVK